MQKLSKAQKTAIAIKEKYGQDFYIRIGRIGGASSNTGGFACTEVGEDGLTGAERAVVAGHKGGIKSRRGKAKKCNK